MNVREAARSGLVYHSIVLVSVYSVKHTGYRNSVKQTTDNNAGNTEPNNSNKNNKGNFSVNEFQSGAKQA